MRKSMDLRKFSDQELLSSISKLVGAHHELTAKLVAYLGEIEERNLHLLAGYSSLFEFCTKALGFSEGEAFRRILAARLGRKFPSVHALLASGEVNLSTLELLREWLTEDNSKELFAAVAGKSKREVQALLAARYPRPDRPSSIRRATIEPISGVSFRVEFTASAALREKLDLSRDLMSHANPTRDLSVVIERGIDLLLAALETKRIGKARRKRHLSGIHRRNSSDRTPSDRTPSDRTPSDRTPSDRTPSDRRISNAVRREVYERDGLQCTYTASGRRCEARAFLELDHRVPSALGGSNDAENLRVLCRAHNQLAAEQVFGRERIERFRHLRQKKSTIAQNEVAKMPGSAPLPLAEHPSRATTFEKVRLALRGMGFRETQARNAIATVAQAHAANERLELERAVREAVLAATAA
jgi:5-methylcytosine-specific restriction endonuclease McrA